MLPAVSMHREKSDGCEMKVAFGLESQRLAQTCSLSRQRLRRPSRASNESAAVCNWDETFLSLCGSPGVTCCTGELKRDAAIKLQGSGSQHARHIWYREISRESG